MIINKEPPPLPPNTDADLVSLTAIMLQKDPERRPTVWMLLEKDCIKEHVQAFLEQEQQVQILDVCPKKQEHDSSLQLDKEEKVEN